MKNDKKDIYIPKELMIFHANLNKSALQAAILHPIQMSASLHESKFAGLPLLLESMEHPKDENNELMLLLAQLNFAELQLVYPFPEEGVLQFYISQHCFEKINHPAKHGQFKVHYFRPVEDYRPSVQDFTYLSDVNINNFPIKSEMKLVAKTRFEPVSATDYRLENYFNREIMDTSITHDERTFREVYLESYLAAEQKIGGYPYFIHEDFRKGSPFLQHYDTLLLQIVSNDEQGIMWGDSGIISFFINSEKLAQLDFSDIYFHTEEY